MIADGLLQFSVAQPLAGAASYTSTNILDFGAAMDLGVTERPTQIFVDWNTAPTGPGAATVTVALQTSAAAAGPWTTLDQTGAMPIAAIAQGTTNPLDFTPGMQRFAQLLFTIAGGPLTTGAVSAGCVLDADGGQRYYRRGYTGV